jgi:hypothetical protein
VPRSSSGGAAVWTRALPRSGKVLLNFASVRVGLASTVLTGPHDLDDADLVAGVVRALLAAAGLVTAGTRGPATLTHCRDVG